MATFFMLCKYSPESLKEISRSRTDKTVGLFKKFGGDIHAMYALLGQNDLVFIVDFPGIEDAMKASVAVSKMAGISITTSPAVSVRDFDKMMSEV